MSSPQFILDPLWITKGEYLDSERLNYILLDATMKYRDSLDDASLEYFYEVLFHLLNLNNLATNGILMNNKFKEVLSNSRIKEIRDSLKSAYEIKAGTTEIFKNANFVFLNIILEYMSAELDIYEKLKLFYKNQRIHKQKEIFIVTNMMGEKVYKIWKLSEDKRKTLGHSFEKIRDIEVPEIRENILPQEIAKLRDPRMKNLESHKNLCFVIIQEETDEDLAACVVKDTILLNKGIAKGLNFENNILSELYRLLWGEKVMPFTLEQWVNDKV